jgi:hypothetical protein
VKSAAASGGSIWRAKIVFRAAELSVSAAADDLVGQALFAY